MSDTVTRGEHSFIDAHGVVVHYYSWRAAEPRAIVQLAHGLGEYATRYEYYAQALAAAGYSLFANDHRGHGATGVGQVDGDLSRLGQLGPGGIRAVVDDLVQFTEVIRGDEPGIPVVLHGHSWGSLLAQMLINRPGAEYDAVILTGTAYRMPWHTNSGDLNKLHKKLGTTGFEWLSRDPQVAAAFVEDPLTFYAAGIKLFGLVDSARLIGRPRRGLRADLALLIMIGAEDSLGGPASVRRLAESYIRRGGLRDVRLKIYPEARHELLNELNRDEVIDDIVAWLDAHLRK